MSQQEPKTIDLSPNEYKVVAGGVRWVRDHYPAMTPGRRVLSLAIASGLVCAGVWLLSLEAENGTLIGSWASWLVLIGINLTILGLTLFIVDGLSPLARYCFRR